jgi:excisionase family DNA binding protein
MEAIRPQLTCSVTEMACMLGISRSKAYACVRAGEVRAIRIGRRVVVPRRVIEELLGSGDQFGSAAVAQPAGQGGESGVEAADVLDGGIGETDPRQNVEHPDRRALNSGVLGGDLRQGVGEDHQRRLPREGSRRRQEAVEAGGAGVVGELLAAGPVVAGQLSLFDAEGCSDIGRGEVEDGQVLHLGSTDAAADLEGRDLVQAPVPEELGPCAAYRAGGVPGSGPAGPVVTAGVGSGIRDIEQAGPGACLSPDRTAQAARRQPSGRVRRVRQR